MRWGRNARHAAPTFIQELADLFGPARCGERSLALVYGSYAYGLAHGRSDVDALVITPEMPDGDRVALVDEIISFHRRWTLALDDEVPFDRKIVADRADVDVAMSGDCFPVKEGRHYATPVRKTREFLCSEEIRLRLLLNALTGKCLQLTGDDQVLADLQRRARRCWLRVLPELVTLPEPWTVEEFVNALIGRPPDQGEMFLGFKPHPTIATFLVDAFDAAARDAADCGLLVRRGHRYRSGPSR